MDKRPVPAASEVLTFGNTNLAAGTPERPLVSFALFAYNQEQFIREAVEGAFSQSYSPLEIILSDDCSSDATYLIMRDMAAKYSGSHVVVLHRTKFNIGKNFFGRRVSEVLENAKGSFIVIAAGDDISLPERTTDLVSQWQSSAQAPISIHSLAQPIDSAGAVIGGPIGCNQVATISLAKFVSNDGRGLLGATHGISKQLIDKFGPLSESILIEDGALAFRARLLSGILFLPKVLVKYRRHASNLSGLRLQALDKQDLDHQLRCIASQHAGFISDAVRIGSPVDIQTVIEASSRRLAELSYIYALESSNPVLIYRAIKSLYPYMNQSFLLRSCFAILRRRLFH